MSNEGSILGRGRRSVPGFVFPTFLAFTLSACAGNPPIHPGPDIAVPSGWTAETVADGAEEPAPGPASREPADVARSKVAELTPAERWWGAFADRRLEALVLEALAHNHDLARAVAAVEAAEAQATLVGADRLPQVSANLGGSKQQQVFVGLPIPGQDGPLKSRSSSWSGGVAVSWEADLWGRLKAGQRAALGDLQASEADLAAARLALSAQVARSWFGLLEVEKQLELTLDIADSRQRTRRRVEMRYRQGLAPSVDLRLARANEARAVANSERLRGRRDAARRGLEVLVGRYPAGRLTAEAAGETALPSPPPPIAPGLPAEIVSRRPDLRASEARLLAAGHRLDEARAAFYPRLTLSGSFGSSSDSIGDLLDGDFSVWSLAGGLLQPIFQGGRLRAAAELADAGREVALADHAQSLLRAFSEVEIALGAERWLAAEEASLAKASEESRAAAELAEDRYRAGVGDYLSVLESQRQAFSNEAALLSVQRQRLTNRVDLHLALGGAIPGASETTSTNAPEAEISALSIPSSSIGSDAETLAMEATEP